MAEYRPGMHRFSVLTAASTLVLIIAGGLVTSNDAGLAVPDWPLSFGRLMPEMVGGVLYEHGHRMIASGVGLLTIVLAVWLWRSEPRGWVRKLGAAALAAVIVQGLLGGLTVLLQLPVAVSVLHACLAQAFFCLTVAIAFVTSRSWLSAASSRPFRWPRLASAVTAAVYLQLLLGAILRHAGTEAGSKAEQIVMPALAAHLLGALLVTVLVVALAIRLLWSESGAPQRQGILLLGLLFSQLLLGVGAYMARVGALGAAGAPLRVWAATSHVAVGAALLAASLLLVLRMGRQPEWAETVPSRELAEEPS